MRFYPAPFALRPLALALSLGCAVLVTPAHAVEPFVLKDIRVEGLQRTDAGTIFASLPFRVGDQFNDEKGAAALRALFATGLFKDVRLDIENGVVTVIVDERSVVGTIEFVGLKEFDKDVLIKALKDFGIAEGSPFDKALADKAEQELKRQYLTRSLYGVKVVATVTPLERNRVNLSFNITEGEVAKISSVRILGTEVFSESTLKGLMELTDSGWMNWYTKADRYSRTKLNADIESIRSYYLNRGYLDFEIVSTDVMMSPDKQDITLTIRIKEGRAYTLTDVSLAGDYLGKEEEFKTLVVAQPGKFYNAEAITSTTKLFTDRFGHFGYAFARVEPKIEIDRPNGLVAVKLVADPQRRVYVRKINVAGNSRTRDEVIRREFRQFESAWYDSRKIKLSRDRVDRLGYFSEVTVENQEVANAPDQVDVVYNIKEKPTGNLQLGAGFSSADRLSLTASIKQENVFGSGNYLGLDLNTSKSQRTLVLSTVDPYFTVDGVSRAYDLFYRVMKPINSQGEEYELLTPGASIRFGVPFSDYDTVFFGLGFERTEIKGSTSLPQNYFNYREQFGARSNAIPLTVGWQRDGRDSAMVPTMGRYMRFNLDWGVGGDTRYLRLNAQAQQYMPLWNNKLTLGLNAELGLGEGLAGKPYPIFKNFFGGGLGTVRAFDQGSLGPVDVTGAYIGGNRRFNANAELYLPVPGTGNDRTLRWFAYMDAGNVWGEYEKVSASSIRASVGLGVSWVSPVGPLKLSYGSPIRKEPWDKIQKLQFQIGTAF